MSTHDDDTGAGHERDEREGYLWDKSGAPDPQIAALENALASRRWSGRLAPGALEPDAPAVPLSRREHLLRALPRALAAGLAAAALLVIGLSFWHALREPHGAAPGDVASADGAHAPSPYTIDAPAGGYRLEGTRAADGALVAGSRLITAADGRVELRVGPIGSVTVEPHTRLRIEDPAQGDGDYLLWLERGSISASIYAAPRLFQLGTPSGIAVDMGCRYTASVDAEGVTRLAVTLGQVSFETPQRKVLVPMGASARAWPGRGPGTPVWDDAPAGFRAAVEALDEAGHALSADAAARGRADAALAQVVATNRPDDSLSLWHLLDDDLDAGLRAGVYERLAALAPPPQGVTREGCLARDARQLLAWRDELGWADWTQVGLGHRGDGSKGSKLEAISEPR